MLLKKVQIAGAGKEDNIPSQHTTLEIASLATVQHMLSSHRYLIADRITKKKSWVSDHQVERKPQGVRSDSLTTA